MKSVAPHPECFISARDGQDARDPRQMLMESRIETRHLRHLRKLLPEGFDQGDFGR